MIEFNGISSTDYGLIVQDHGRRARAEEDIRVYQIPNRNGSYREHTGFFKPYERTMSFHIMDMTMKSAIFSWLEGYGMLRTTVDPERFFKASITSELSVTDDEGLEQFEVTMEIDPPFAYLDYGEVPISLTAPSMLYNPGTHMAEPLIRVIGSGNITVTINGRIFTLTGVETFLDIDPEIVPSVFKNNENVGEKMVGELPYFDVGENVISWTGAVTELNILPRWRDL